MNFNFNTAPAADGESIKPTAMPDIYTGYLRKVEKKAVDTKNGEKEVLAFRFGTADGTEHEYWEWAPEAGDDEKKVANLLARLKHIVKRYAPDLINKIESGQQEVVFTDWDGLCSWVISNIDPLKDKVQVKFKVVGSVYKGKANCDFPKYPSFLANATDNFDFSNSERKSNAEYFAFKKNASGGPSNEEDVPQDAEADW